MHPQPLARSLVHIRRANAPCSGPNGPPVLLVGFNVMRHDDMRICAYHEVFWLNGYLVFLKKGYFLKKHFWIDDNPIAYHCNGPLAQDSRRDEVKHDLLLSDNQGMACVVDAVVARDHICLF